MHDKHTFDRRNDNTIQEMKRNEQDNRTVYCIKCHHYITKEHLDDECGS